MLKTQGIPLETKQTIITEFLSSYNLTLTDNEGKTALDYAEEHCPELLWHLMQDQNTQVTAELQDTPEFTSASAVELR